MKSLESTLHCELAKCAGMVNASMDAELAVTRVSAPSVEKQRALVSVWLGTKVIDIQ